MRGALTVTVTQPFLECHPYVAHAIEEKEGLCELNFSAYVWIEKFFSIFNKLLSSQCLHGTAFVGTLNEYPKFSHFFTQGLKIVKLHPDQWICSQQ